MTGLGSPLNETTLIREHLKHLGDRSGVLTQAAQVLELAAHSCVGLGEVLQDYATQSSSQLQDILRVACQLAEDGCCRADDRETLRNIQLILKSAKTVLQMTPVAMQRNKAAALGQAQTFTCADVMRVSETFSRDTDIAWLLQTDDAGAKLIEAIDWVDETNGMSASEPAEAFSGGPSV